MDAILNQIMPLCRPSGNAYVVFGDDPPVGPVPTVCVCALSLIISPVSVAGHETCFPPLNTVRTYIIQDTPTATPRFYFALTLLAGAGLATVEECMTCGAYVENILEKYPDHARELYQIYFNNRIGTEQAVTVLQPNYLSDDQLHRVIDRVTTGGGYLLGDRARQTLGDWAGHGVYCSVTARMGYFDHRSPSTLQWSIN